MMFSSQVDAFSPSQFTASQNAAADSTPNKFRGASGTMPLTVKQIADAQLAGTGEKGAPFVVDGVETTNVRLVGMVSGKAERNTDVSFTLDDGTGRIDFIRWVNDAADSAETAAIQNGMYVAVIGSLKGVQDKKRATAFAVRPITDYNEVTLHFIQCVRMHIENTKSKVGSPLHTNSSVGTPLSNRLSEAATPPSVKSNLAPVISGTNGSETDFYTQVLNVFREPANMEAIDYHVDVGHIYSTIDDFHYKSAFVD
ncbi:hypothetical protein ACQJBY_056947 [Aegilops geniculata]